MIKKVFLVFFLAFGIAQSASIKNIEIFDRSNALDLLFFSTQPFSQNPKILDSQNQKIITLQGSFQKKWQKKPTSILSSIEVFSKNNLIYIIPKSNNPFEVKAAKSKDGHTLRLRFIPVKKIDNINTLIHKTPDLKSTLINTPQNQLPLKQDDYRYWLVLGFMAILVIALLFVRKRLNTKNLWHTNSKVNTFFEVILNKNIDSANKILMVKIQDFTYIVLLNNKQNLLIDKITSKNPKDNSTTISDDFWESLKQKATNNKNAR